MMERLDDHLEMEATKELRNDNSYVDGGARLAHIVINVGGSRFYLFKSQLNRQPDSRLTDLESLGPNFRSELNEYYFDRNPTAFKAIANYYKTGKLHLPRDVCGAEFRDELFFWRINPDLLEECCWVRYQRAARGDNATREYKGRNVVWKILENAHPFILTKMYPLISSMVIITMMCVLTVSSMPKFHDNNRDEITPLDAVALFCLAFFATELLVYLVFFFLEIIMRRKPTLNFLLRPIIVLDIITTAAWALFIFEPLTHAAFDITVWMIIPLRSFRIVWFLRFWNPGRGLTHFLETKWKSLLLVLFTMVLAAIYFASWMYFAEPNFIAHPDLLDSLWWAFVTICTLGYGHMYPKTLEGKPIAVLCGLFAIVFHGLYATIYVTTYLEYFRSGRFNTPPGGGKRRKSECVEVEGAEEAGPFETQSDWVHHTLHTACFLTDGAVFEISRTSLSNVTLETFPTDSRGSYILDGDADCVSAILNYYRTGQLHIPQDCCGDDFKLELDKWNLDPDLISDCCWLQYRRSWTARIDSGTRGEGGGAPANGDGTPEPKHWSKTVWEVLENTDPSWYTKLYVTISSVFIFATVFIPEDRYINDIDADAELALRIREWVCFGYFVLELGLRLAFCPRKATFFIRLITIFDVLSILGMLIPLILLHTTDLSTDGVLGRAVLASLMSLKYLRGFHFVYFLRQLAYARGLWYTMIHGVVDVLYVLILYISFAFTFAVWVYIVESVAANSHFNDIPGALWWAFITITTVGYGDVIPVTPQGRTVGVLCGICGVFLYSTMTATLMQRYDEYRTDVQYKRNKNNNNKTRFVCVETDV